MAHDKQAGRVTTVRRDVLVHPAEGARDVAGDGAHVDGGQQAVIAGDELEQLDSEYTPEYLVEPEFIKDTTEIGQK